MRLFVALEIPATVRERFAVLMNDLRALDAKTYTKKRRWVRPENLHVTLKFLGSVDAQKLDGVCAALSEIRSAAPVELQLHGLGFFPGPTRPRVFWAGVEASPNVAGLASDIDQRLTHLGFPGETRAFTPHLTLARCEPSGISVELRAAMERDSVRDFGGLRTNEFHLIESKLKPTGAEYTTLQSFVFAAEA